MWERVVGQDRAVELLRRAVQRPVHAYLLVGPAGSGVDAAARCFAASLVCGSGGCGECPACERVLRGRHPDVVEVEPAGTNILVEQAEEIVEAAFRTPVEADRKVVIIREAERMNAAAANKLLKTFEEPSASTTFVLVTSAPDELLPTVRSRCQEVAFGSLGEGAVRDALVAGGVAAEEAERLARLSAGHLDRAHRLAGEHRALIETFVTAPARVDGTGGRAAVLADELWEAVEEAFSALKARHATECEELDDEIERMGYPDRAATRLKKTLTDRHERIERRARLDALTEGLTALEVVYRDALVAPGEALHPEASGLGLSAPACLEAIDACAALRREVQDGKVLNWTLHLQRLLLRLPVPAGDPDRLAHRSPE